MSNADGPALTGGFLRGLQEIIGQTASTQRPEDFPEPAEDDLDEPCGESHCRCSCTRQHGPCGCDCPRDDYGQLSDTDD